MSKKVKKAKLDGFVVALTREYGNNGEDGPYTNLYLVKTKTEKAARKLAMSAQIEAENIGFSNLEADFLKEFERILLESGVEVQYIQPAYVATQPL
jgi:hypothetical protein